MIEYLTQLDYRWISGNEIVLLQPLVAYHPTIKLEYLPPYVDQDLIIIPPGFFCDGASIPKAAWSIIGHPFGDYLREAITHDWLYGTEFAKQSTSDQIFLEAMADSGNVGWMKRNAMWGAVRMFGGGVWSKHTKESIMECRVLLDKYLAGEDNPESWECPLGPDWKIYEIETSEAIA